MTKRHEHIMRAKDDYRPYSYDGFMFIFLRRWICTFRGCRYHEMRETSGYFLQIVGVER